MTEHVIYVFAHPEELEDTINKRLAKFEQYKIKHIYQTCVTNDVDDILVSAILVVNEK